MAFEENTVQVNPSLKCKECGAMLEYKIGTSKLQCKFCGTENEIEADADTKIVSFDYNEFIASGITGDGHTRTETIVKCENCGASVDLAPGVTSDNCPFCASPLVISMAAETKVLKPHYMLPFLVDKKKAFDSFQRWMKKLWFAPSDLVKKSTDGSSRQLQGIYLPYWSYDSDTMTSYSGSRGEYYYTTETYTETQNGQRVTRERRVRHTAWHPVSGIVHLRFADLLVSASPSLPQKIANKMEPWKLEMLQAFNERYLSGFRSETYQVSAQDGFEVAKQKMAPSIRAAILKDIGGDEQTISSFQSNYSDTALKYLTLPVWLSSYRYKGKLYQFYINACTGEVAGQRPYSVVKIVLAILLAIALCVGIYFLIQRYNQHQDTKPVGAAVMAAPFSGVPKVYEPHLQYEGDSVRITSLPLAFHSNVMAL